MSNNDTAPDHVWLGGLSSPSDLDMYRVNVEDGGSCSYATQYIRADLVVTTEYHDKVVAEAVQHIEALDMLLSEWESGQRTLKNCKDSAIIALGRKGDK